jgi:hypothetical protein
MPAPLTPAQQLRVNEIRELERVVARVKRLVGELEANRAGRPAVIADLSNSIERELSQLRRRAVGADLESLGDVAGTLSVLAGRTGGGIQLKIRGLTEGLQGLETEIEGALRVAMAPATRPSSGGPATR